jgi:long-chain acyl-CoA synthetase
MTRWRSPPWSACFPTAGGTPVACVARRPGAKNSAEELKAWLNERVGKTQRLADLCVLDTLPRSHIGRVLKRELRDNYAVSGRALQRL